MQESYIPKGALEAKQYPSSPCRLLLVGLSGTGKTFSSLLDTPNPIIADFDNKLSGFRLAHPEIGFHAIPFWDMKFCVETMKCLNDESGKPNNPKYPPNSRDAFKYWLAEEGLKLQPNQTFILDSWTSLQASFDTQSSLPHEIVFSKKTGEEDTYKFWGRKKNYARDVTTALKSLQCNVIVIAHETFERNDNGSVIGLKALMDGSYADELPSQFTDVYRQRIFTQEEAAKLNLKQAGYYWQTNKDQYFKFSCKANPKLNDYIPATWTSLL